MFHRIEIPHRVIGIGNIYDVLRKIQIGFQGFLIDFASAVRIVHKNICAAVNHADAAVFDDVLGAGIAAIKDNHIGRLQHREHKAAHILKIVVKRACIYGGYRLIYHPSLREGIRCKVSQLPHAVPFYDDAFRLVFPAAFFQEHAVKIFLIFNGLDDAVGFHEQTVIKFGFAVLAHNHQGLFALGKVRITQAQRIGRMRDMKACAQALAQTDYVSDAQVVSMELGTGSVQLEMRIPQEIFYQIAGEQSGLPIRGEADLIPLLTKLAAIQKEYQRFDGALQQVQQTGYGIVMPTIDELKLDEPEIVRQGGRYGVRLTASAPSIHMIRADIQTEVSPIVGSEKQSADLVAYLMSEFNGEPERIWQTNIFGKSLNELVSEGMNTKLARMPEDARSKLQETLERIINEGSGGLICIIL